MALVPSPLKAPVPNTDHEVGTLPSITGAPACGPSMNQIAVLPLVSRHSRSALPSPLKSRCPTIDHVVGTLPNPWDVNTFAPFMSQIAMLPLVSCQAMSLLLSPLKSWVLVLEFQFITRLATFTLPMPVV